MPAHVCDAARGREGAPFGLDRRTTRHAAYAASQRRRKQIEEASGWGKTIAGIGGSRSEGLPACATASRWR
jgi:hypothetical protein